MSRRQRRTRASSVGGQGHRRGGSTIDRWIKDACTNLFYMEFLHEDMVIKIYEALFMH